MLIEALKSLPNTLNVLLFLTAIALVLNKVGKRNAARYLAGFTLLLFLLVSTAFFPRFAMRRLESTYTTFDNANVLFRPGQVLVHVLGAGYSLDTNLPPNGQLELVTLGRLVEGLRICRQIPGSQLICSGYSSLGLESQASVVRGTAINLGFDSTRISILSTPSNTQEEAKALADAFGTDVNVIVVTNAVHMPRAMKLFRKEGFEPIAAPTNYVIKGGSQVGYLKWLPSTKNISLTDRVFHEFLGNLKAEIL